MKIIIALAAIFLTGCGYNVNVVQKDGHTLNFEAAQCDLYADGRVELIPKRDVGNYRLVRCLSDWRVFTGGKDPRHFSDGGN